MNNKYFILSDYFLMITLAVFCFVNVDLFAQPIQSTTQYQQSRQLLAQGKYQQAVDVMKKLISDPKYQVEAMVEAGKIQIRQAENEMSSALAHFSEAANAISAGIKSGKLKGPDVSKTLYDLGRIYEERLKNYFEAAKVYEQLIAEHPDFMSIDKIYFHLATCYEEMNMNDKAVENYTKIVEDYQYSTFFKVAQAKMKSLAVGTSNEKKAIEAQENLVDDTQTLAEEAQANLDLGDMKAEAGDYSQAEDAYRKATQSDNPDTAVKAYRKLIDMMNEKEKNYDDAAKAVEELTTKYPDYPGNEEYVYKLGRIYETDLTDLKTRVVDGRVLYRKSPENIEKAINYYNIVTEKYPDADVCADAYLRKGELYEKDLNEYDKARQSYEDFLQNFPQRPEANEVRQKLKSLSDY